MKRSFYGGDTVVLMVLVINLGRRGQRRDNDTAVGTTPVWAGLFRSIRFQEDFQPRADVGPWPGGDIEPALQRRRRVGTGAGVCDRSRTFAASSSTAGCDRQWTTAAARRRLVRARVLPRSRLRLTTRLTCSITTKYDVNNMYRRRSKIHRRSATIVGLIL